VKAAAELLASRQRDDSGAFSRGEGIASPPAEPVRFALQPPSALANAVSRWLTRLPSKPIGVPTFRVVSLREMIVMITSTLERDGQTTFDHIRATCTDRQGTAVAFLALLTLMRRQIIVVTQTELFGSITVSRREIAFIQGLPASFESHQSDGREHAV
jgi:chromatin segregation and condensation protein Rec8/ScpA/Scc1 (kleisin family)